MHTIDTTILDRMVSAVEKVRERLMRATQALEAAQVKYAVAGGNAIGAWVATVDETAVRNTQDVDILLRRSDLPTATAALEKHGFIYRHTAELDVFLDGTTGKARDAVHIIFASEKVRPHEPVDNPDVDAAKWIGAFRVIALQELVQIKLTAFRDKDRVHLRDLIDVGLIDGTWVQRFPQSLGDRLQSLIDTPNG